MKTSKYDELKIKYEVLLKENKYLKTKIRELESNSEVVIPHHEPVQSKEPVLKQQCDATALSDNFPNDILVTRRISRCSQNHEKIALSGSILIPKWAF